MASADRDAGFELATTSRDPAAALLALAEALKAGGMSREDVYALFDRHRAAHRDDADEAAYDAILDTMDRVGGWCRPDARLFDEPTNT